jgi:hypothetical protein
MQIPILNVHILSRKGLERREGAAEQKVRNELGGLMSLLSEQLSEQTKRHGEELYQAKATVRRETQQISNAMISKLIFNNIDLNKRLQELSRKR